MKGGSVVEMAANLLQSLHVRDSNHQDKYYDSIKRHMAELEEDEENEELTSQANNDFIYEGYEGIDELKEEMDNIKILCIATHILEMTRILENTEKLHLESFCDKIMLSRFQ